MNGASQGTLGVVHVPKTGGGALRVAFEGVPGCYVGPLYTDADVFEGLDIDGLPATTRNEFASVDALRGICRENRLVMGHYSVNALLDAGCGQIATQLREPRSRLLSLYRFWQSLPSEVIESWGGGVNRPLVPRSCPWSSSWDRRGRTQQPTMPLCATFWDGVPMSGANTPPYGHLAEPSTATSRCGIVCESLNGAWTRPDSPTC